MKKLLLLAFVVLILPISAFSQHIGLRFGFLGSSIKQQSALLRPTFGVFFETKGGVYFNGGFDFKVIGGTKTIVVTDAQNNNPHNEKRLYSYQYIEMPLLIGKRGEGKKINPFINIGLSPAILIGSKYNSSNIPGESFNLGAVLSPGLMMSDKTSIEMRVTKSLMPVYKTAFISQDYISFAFILSYRF